MNRVTVDARGQLCPKPLIMTRKALKEAGPDAQLTILIDNETSKQNVERFLTDNKVAFNTVVEDGVYSIGIGNAPVELVRPDAESYCAPPAAAARQPHAIAFRSDKMGTGSDELGAILVKVFMGALEEITPLPGHIVFYNSGIFLALKDSPIIESLQGLEAKGVKMLVCGTCADYYRKKADVGVGTISNMYTILETLAASGHVISP